MLCQWHEYRFEPCLNHVQRLTVGPLPDLVTWGAILVAIHGGSIWRWGQRNRGRIIRAVSEEVGLEQGSGVRLEQVGRRLETLKEDWSRGGVANELVRPAEMSRELRKSLVSDEMSFEHLKWEWSIRDVEMRPRISL